MEDMGFANTEARVSHWTPGRIRITFRDTAFAEQFANSVAKMRGVISAKANSLTGSVLVQYTDAIGDVRRILDCLNAGRACAEISGHDVCTHCRQPIRVDESSDIVSRLLSLLGAILTGDVIGIVSWLVLAFDSASKPSEQPQLRSYALAA